MTKDRLLKSLPGGKPPEKIVFLKPLLTREQFECLSRCASGISIRFEREELVDALIAGGYAEKGVAGVISVTHKGLEYLRTYGS